MAFSKNFYIVFAIVVCIAVVSGKTVKTFSPPDGQDAPTTREGRFYGGMGMAGSQASASAFSSAGGMGGGYGGYPMGGYGGYGWGK